MTILQMTTLEQRELASVSDISKPTLQTESKYASDKAHRKANAMAIYRRDLRKLDGTNELAPYTHEITNALGNPRDKILWQINAGNYKIITNEEAKHTPYRRAA